MRRPNNIAVAAILVSSVFLSACGDDDEPTASAGTSASDGSTSGGHGGHDETATPVDDGA